MNKIKLFFTFFMASILFLVNFAIPASAVAPWNATGNYEITYLLDGDLGETRDSLQNLLTSVQSYEKKVTHWHEQVEDLIKRTPTWIDRTAVGLTIFLLWFALSQFGLFLHGLGIWAGGNPLVVLRRDRPGPRKSLMLEDDEIRSI